MKTSNWTKNWEEVLSEWFVRYCLLTSKLIESNQKKKTQGFWRDTPVAVKECLANQTEEESLGFIEEARIMMYFFIVLFSI